MIWNEKKFCLETKIKDNAIIYDKLRVVSFKFEVTMQEKRVLRVVLKLWVSIKNFEM